MRVLHTESSDNWGGQEYRILEQMQWLEAHGHRAFLAARPGSEIVTRARAWGLEAVEIGFHGHYNPAAILATRRLIRRLGIDVADGHGSRDPSALAFCRDLCTVIRSRHVTQPLKGKRHRRLQWSWGCDRAIATARCIKDGIVNAGLLPPERVAVVGEWAADGFFDVTAKARHRAEVRAEFAVPDHRPLVVVVGMLRGDKAQEVLIDTAAEMRARGRPIVGVLVGSGIRSQAGYAQELRDRMKSLGLTDSIRFAGYRDDVARLTQAADALVITSIAVEAQSRTAPQAFAARTPVVASRVGGLPELIRPGETGWLVAPGAVAEYADALTAVLGDADGTAVVVARARRFAERHLRFDGRMAETLAVYEGGSP